MVTWSSAVSASPTPLCGISCNIWKDFESCVLMQDYINIELDNQRNQLIRVRHFPVVTCKI